MYDLNDEIYGQLTTSVERHWAVTRLWTISTYTALLRILCGDRECQRAFDQRIRLCRVRVGVIGPDIVCSSSLDSFHVSTISFMKIYCEIASLSPTYTELDF